MRIDDTAVVAHFTSQLAGGAVLLRNVCTWRCAGQG